MPSVPYLCLLLAFILIYVPRIFVAREQARQPEGLDNAHPRAQQAKLGGLGARAQGAHMNGFEAFAPFAAGILACELRHVDLARTAAFGLAFVVLRAIYVGLYLGNVPTMRTVVWALGALCTGALLLSAVLAS